MSDYIDSVSTLLTNLDEIKTKNNYPGEKWWRGQENQYWGLLPTTFRNKSSISSEYERYIKFIYQAPSRHSSVPSKDDLSGWLFLMRHYGLKTRLLDWTRSPLYALYFAVKAMPKKDGAIFLLAPSILNEIYSKNRAIYTPDVKAIIERINLPFTQSGKDSLYLDALALVPDEIDIRLLVQRSVFTIHSIKTPLEKQSDSKRYLKKFIVPSSSKKGIMNNLLDFGISESFLFPDLEHLAQDLN